MWVICDAKLCHLFSSDDNGQLYRSETPIDQFPNGFNEPVIAMEDENMWDFLEASNVYSYGPNKYLLIVEVASGGTEHGPRYFRSWTSTDIAGPWRPLADTEENPFARMNNVRFKDGKTWTKDISHGELIRKGIDQRLEIHTCDLKYIYQGADPTKKGPEFEYNSIPWRLSLLTEVGSKC